MFVLGVLVLCIVCLALYLWTASQSKPVTKGLQLFKRRYLIIFGLANASDWLQGPYTFSLYKSYGYELDDISLLFVIGFLSSAVFGTFAGVLVDKLGRKRGCLAFCIIYALSCLSKPFSNFQILVFGRVTGGLATSLLFSAFESWLVCAFTENNFDPDELQVLFSESIMLNGCVAIVSGLVADLAVSVFGLLGPFYVATFVLLIAFCLILLWWTENYGTRKESNTFLLGLEQCTHWHILSVGMIQCCMETAMYSFVFLWAPVMERQMEHVPFGLVFSSFMLSLMCGSLIVKKIHDPRYLLLLAFSIASLAFVIVVHLPHQVTTYVCFNLFELACGLYFPSMAAIKSTVIPEATRSTVMNLFRVPLNLMVVIMLRTVTDFNATFYILTLSSLTLAWQLNGYKAV
ncbi:hypothetical protein EDD86DRAFT_194854 [Gorgonomyces haynaldii]|nr:hypothetical protein EDD86DRAFT_194854 [Gorgonomyces haynaldii]